MTIIKKKGMPNRSTKGALGTIYVDTETGKKYKCTQSYSCTTVGGIQQEYEWKLIFEDEPKQEIKKPVTPPPVVEEVVKPAVENVEEVEVKTAKTNNKHNYSKYYNKK